MSLAHRWHEELQGELDAAIQLRHRLHSMPRLSEDETETAAAVVAALGLGGGDRVAGTGRLLPVTMPDDRGEPPAPAVAMRAELDALPIVEATHVDWRSRSGAMHACGHDIHLAALVAVCRSAARLALPLPLVALLQPREESADSGARDIVAEGRLAGVGEVVAAHVQPRVPEGVIAVTPGVVNADTAEFTVTVRGQGGHSGYPHTVTDSVLALSAIVVALQQISARRIDPVVGVACMVTQLSAGAANNVVPGFATGSGTIRTMRTSDRDTARAALVDIAVQTASAYGCRAEVSFSSGEPALRNDPGLAGAAARIVQELGRPAITDFRSFGSDDFSHFGDHARCLMMFVGTGTASGSLHDATYLPADDYVELVADALIAGYCAAAESR